MKTFRLGLDLGSTAAKAVLLDEHGALLAARIDATGKLPADAARTLADALLSERNISRNDSGILIKTVATGYGRSLAGLEAKTVTEITCHARGVRRLHPDALGILDIGGQDAKAIRLEKSDASPGGAGITVADFAMNDRCAAGTGRFLEVAASRYGLSVAGLSAFCLDDPEQDGKQNEKTPPFEISSTCVVFAESELVSLNAKGTPPVEALRAVHRAIARRTALLLRQADVGEPLYFTGGVARNETLRKAIASASGMEIRRAAHPQFTGAIGAALLA